MASLAAATAIHVLSSRCGILVSASPCMLSIHEKNVILKLQSSFSMTYIEKHSQAPGDFTLDFATI